MPKPSTYLKVFRLGDYVDIMCDPAIHGGMPYRFYYGKTGRVWNMSKRAVGVELLKTVGNRKRTKKVTVRIEHIRHSTCRVPFLKRIKANDVQKKAVKAGKAEFKDLKRKPQGPKGGYVLKKRSCKKVLPMW